MSKLLDQIRKAERDRERLFRNPVATPVSSGLPGLEAAAEAVAELRNRVEAGRNAGTVPEARKKQDDETERHARERAEARAQPAATIIERFAAREYARALAEEKAAAEASAQRAVRERERTEEQAVREAAARAETEAHASEHARRQEGAGAERQLLRVARRALKAMRPGRMPLAAAAVLVALAAGIGAYTTIARVPRPAAAAADQSFSLRLDRNVEALAARLHAVRGERE